LFLQIVNDNLILSQKIFVRDDTGNTLPEVNITIECTYPLPSPPEPEMFIGSIAQSTPDSNDMIGFFASRDSSFTSTFGADAVVSLVIYFIFNS